MTAHHKRRVSGLDPKYHNPRGVDDRDWQRVAPCRQDGPHDDILFPELGPGAADAKRAAHTARARALFCNHCPVRQRCYQLGVDIAAEWGIWGGHNFDIPHEQKIRNRQERRAQ